MNNKDCCEQCLNLNNKEVKGTRRVGGMLEDDLVLLCEECFTTWCNNIEYIMDNSDDS